jgi:hypothetical protein
MCYIYYKNDSKKILTENLEFTQLVGLKMCKPFRGNKYSIKVASGEKKIVLLKVDPQSEEISKLMKMKPVLLNIFLRMMMMLK